MSQYRSVAYQQHCITSPMISSLVMGTVFTGVDTLGGAPFTAQRVGKGNQNCPFSTF